MSRTISTVIFWVALGIWTARPLYAVDRIEPLPEELEGVGVTEHLDTQIPLNLTFKDENGNTVQLGQYFKGGKPIILNLGYYRCPMLCGLVLNGLTDSLTELKWTAGDQFDVLTVSIDALETPVLAKLKKQNQLKAYGRPQGASGWHFLTGDEKNIRALTDAVGFGFNWNEKRQEYAHAAVIMVLTPDGRVSRYLYGVMFEPKTVRLSLVEAAQGKIGSPMDQFILFCFHYDAQAGKYTPVALNIMKAGGGVVLLGLGALLGVFWRREWKKQHAAPPPPSDATA